MKVHEPRFGSILRRFNQFKSISELASRLGRKLPYTTWDRRVFDDYCAHALLTKAELAELSETGPGEPDLRSRSHGGAPGVATLPDVVGAPETEPNAEPLALACPPAVEHDWYTSSFKLNLGPRLHLVTAPTALLTSGEMNGEPSGPVVSMSGELTELAKPPVSDRRVGRAVASTLPSSKMNFLGSPTDPNLWHRIPGLLPDLSGECGRLNHFIVMQSPKFIADRILAVLTSVRSANNAVGAPRSAPKL